MERSLALVAASTACRNGQEGQLAQRVFLYPNELYRVPPTYRQVRARHGIAHIAQNGRDFVVLPGECVSLAQSADAALVSPLRGQALVLELFQ
ncbi:MAG: hypothetical protein R3C14_52455 [Caldilineaceae bacterium]